MCLWLLGRESFNKALAESGGFNAQMVEDELCGAVLFGEHGEEEMLGAEVLLAEVAGGGFGEAAKGGVGRLGLAAGRWLAVSEP